MEITEAQYQRIEHCLLRQRGNVSLGPTNRPLHLSMDKAYEGDETRQLALDPGFISVVPPKSTRLQPWKYDREMYKRRNEVELLFRRLKGFRRIFSRFDKLDIKQLGLFHATSGGEAALAVHHRRIAIRSSGPSAA
jgi:transposase